MISNILLCLLLIALLAFSAFFSSSETAFLSLTKVQIRQILKQNLKNANIIASLKSNVNKLLSTIAIGNNFVMAASSSIAAAFAISLVGRSGAAIATVIMSVLIILFGEILPKTLASFFPLKLAQSSARILHLLEIIFFPIVWVFTKIADGLNIVFSKLWHIESQQITENELKTLIDVGSKEGTIKYGEKEMLNKIFEFTDLRTRDIQKHRSLVQSLPINATYHETIALIATTGFSRIPIYEDSPHNIIGLIHFKDLLFYTDTPEDFSLNKIMHPVLFVPETKPALELLYFFKKQKQHFAVVVDEHGSNSGIVTMDDILKAVFGRVTDEYNTRTLPAEDRITVISPRDFLIPGDLFLSDINKFFSLNLESEDCNTLGGWLTEQFGYLPESSEMLRYKGLLFRIEDQSQRRIQTIRLVFPKDYTKSSK